MPSSLAAATAREKIFVLQSIAYEPSEDANGHPGTGPGEVVPAYNPNSFVDFFPGVWRGSETVNGQLDPVITMQPGEVQRWRFIDAAFRASIHLELQKCPEGLSTVACETRSKLGNAACRSTAGSARDRARRPLHRPRRYLGRNRPRPLCVASYPDATQGITPSSQCPYIDLEPGYRSDVLFKAPAPGTYKLVDVRSGPHTSLLGVSEPDAVSRRRSWSGRPPLAMSVPTGQELKPLAYRPVTRVSGIRARKPALDARERRAAVSLVCARLCLAEQRPAEQLHGEQRVERCQRRPVRRHEHEVDPITGTRYDRQVETDGPRL